MSVEKLFNETRLMFHTLKHWAETLHQGLDLSVPMRGVLELILLAGETTVPAMARARGVSRQHIQQQVDALLDKDLLERSDNPAHKRSPLIVLSDKGRALIENMRAEERNALGRLQVGVSDASVIDAAHVLEAWREALRADIERRTR